MQTSPFSRTTLHHVFSRKNLSSITALIGAAGFMLSLVMAVVLAQGNLGMLAIWLAATLAMLAFMRIHRRWRAMFERIYALQPAQTVLAARKDWRGNVEDVVFREIAT